MYPRCLIYKAISFGFVFTLKSINQYKYDLILKVDVVSDVFLILKVIYQYKYDHILLDNCFLYQHICYETTSCLLLFVYLTDYFFCEASKMEVTNVVAAQICTLFAILWRSIQSDVHCIQVFFLDFLKFVCWVCKSCY